MNIVKKLVWEKKISAVMAMHDLNLASRFSDSIVMLKDKKVFKVGDPKSILISENIERVYGVRAEVIKDSKGMPYIMPIEPV